MTLTIELPDDLYEAVRLEAEYYGLTAKERIEHMIEKTHRHRVTHPLAEMRERLDHLVEQGETIPLRELIPPGSKSI